MSTKTEKLINLQPHEVTPVDLPPIAPSGLIARVSEELLEVDSIGGYPLLRQKFGSVTIYDIDKSVYHFPDYKEGTYYIVSILVAQALPYRKDLLFPVGQVRDEKGRIIGCKGLSSLHA